MQNDPFQNIVYPAYMIGFWLLMHNVYITLMLQMENFKLVLIYLQMWLYLSLLVLITLTNKYHNLFVDYILY